jgi:hypothetical protein
VGGEAPVTLVSSLDSSSLNLSYKPCDNIINYFKQFLSMLANDLRVDYAANCSNFDGCNKDLQQQQPS